MEVSKNTAVLEITNDSAKFSIGYAIGGQPIIIYRTERSLKGFLKDGFIADPKGVVEAIKDFLHIEDEAAKLKINALNLSIIIPPLGLQIYQNTKITNVVSTISCGDHRYHEPQLASYERPDSWWQRDCRYHPGLFPSGQ